MPIKGIRTSPIFVVATLHLIIASSRKHLLGKTAEELAEERRPVSHNNCSVKRAEKILNLVKSDGETRRER